MRILAAALFVFAAACGEGRVILNVDVYSFMAGSGNDSIPYAIPPASSGSVSTFQRIILPGGLGSSVVDSVRITNGGVNLVNSTGAGTIGFSFFFAADSLGTLTAPAALILPDSNVSGTNTTTVVLAGDLSSTVNTLFTRDTLWMRIRAAGDNPGAVPVTGTAVLTALVLRVVVQDKVF
jgi:hypothetical protein